MVTQENFGGTLPHLWVNRSVLVYLDNKEFTCNAGDTGSILDWEDPLEKGLATRSSVLAWRIPQTEEPGGLQSMGSQGVRTLSD